MGFLLCCCCCYIKCATTKTLTNYNRKTIPAKVDSYKPANLHQAGCDIPSIPHHPSHCPPSRLPSTLKIAFSFPKHVYWANPEISLLSHSTEEGNKTHPWFKLFLQVCQLKQSYPIHMAKIYCVASCSCNRRSTTKQHCSHTRALGCPDASSYTCALWLNRVFSFRQ